MTSFRILTLATALSGAAALPVFAGSLTDPVIEPAVPAPVIQAAPAGYDWTGGYVGAAIGYGNSSATGGLDGSGELYGLRAGYDYDFGSWVLGAGIDYDAANLDFGGGAGSIDNVARLKLRAGADLGQMLVYGTAGMARADAEIAGTNYSDDGYFGGVGVDYRLNDRWTVGGEVLVHDFDNFDGTGVDVNATTASLNTTFRF